MSGKKPQAPKNLLPPASKNAVITQIARETFSGPIPPPAVLDGYKSVDPTIPDRIVTMAEKQQEHRTNIEEKTIALKKLALESAFSGEKRGQIFTVTVSLSAIIGSIGLIAMDKGVYGMILGGSTLIGLTYVSITGRKKQSGN